MKTYLIAAVAFLALAQYALGDTLKGVDTMAQSADNRNQIINNI